MGRKPKQHKAEDFTPGEIVWISRSEIGLPLVPPEIKVNPLLLAALHGINALDDADEESADPDWTVEVLESMYEYLGRVNRPLLFRELQKLIEYSQKAKWPRKLVTMLKKELKHFGGKT